MELSRVTDLQPSDRRSGWPPGTAAAGGWLSIRDKGVNLHRESPGKLRDQPENASGPYHSKILSPLFRLTINTTLPQRSPPAAWHMPTGAKSRSNCQQYRSTPIAYSVGSQLRKRERMSDQSRPDVLIKLRRCTNEPPSQGGGLAIINFEQNVHSGAAAAHGRPHGSHSILLCIWQQLSELVLANLSILSQISRSSFVPA